MIYNFVSLQHHKIEMFKTDHIRFHPLELDHSEDLPERFTYPFYYQSHSLCIKAADEVKTYLNTQTDFEHNFGLDPTKRGLKIGKMFGVMSCKPRKVN